MVKNFINLDMEEIRDMRIIVWSECSIEYNKNG